MPYKLTKVNYQRAVEFARPDFKHEELVYRNCVIVKDDRNLVFTDQRVVVYSVDCEQLKQIVLKDIHFDIKEIFCVEPAVPAEERFSIIFSCHMKMVSALFGIFNASIEILLLV